MSLSGRAFAVFYIHMFNNLWSPRSPFSSLTVFRPKPEVDPAAWMKRIVAERSYKCSPSNPLIIKDRAPLEDITILEAQRLGTTPKGRLAARDVAYLVSLITESQQGTHLSRLILQKRDMNMSDKIRNDWLASSNEDSISINIHRKDLPPVKLIDVSQGCDHVFLQLPTTTEPNEFIPIRRRTLENLLHTHMDTAGLIDDRKHRWIGRVGTLDADALTRVYKENAAKRSPSRAERAYREVIEYELGQRVRGIVLPHIVENPGLLNYLGIPLVQRIAFQFLLGTVSNRREDFLFERVRNYLFTAPIKQQVSAWMRLRRAHPEYFPKRAKV